MSESQIHKYLTPDGYVFMKARLNQLLYNDRPETTQAVSEAAALGDRSENADYIYGKRKLRDIDREIRRLQMRLDGAKIVDQLPVERHRIFFGARVHLEDDDGNAVNLRIVGVGEILAESDYIHVSLNAPMAKALLGKSIDDDISVAGVGYTIVDVCYQDAAIS
jgi:transcription elongation factor GreB